MQIDFSVNETVNKRYSVRTFDERPVESEIKEKILSYASSLQNPLAPTAVKFNCEFAAGIFPALGK